VKRRAVLFLLRLEFGSAFIFMKLGGILNAMLLRLESAEKPGAEGFG
jgi:hypothetical protein